MKITDIQPVFILGNPRSGTSLFRLMLNSHQNIVATPECGFSHWLLNEYHNWSDKDNVERVNKFIQDVQNSKKFETWYLQNDEIKKIITNYRPKNYAELVTCVYLAYAENPSQVSIVADKNNYYINHIEGLPKIWPQAKYIHLIRDGRDVACSYKGIKEVQADSKYIPKLPTDIKEIAEEWKENNRRIAEIKNWNTENYYVLRFEDLVLEPKRTLNKLMRFLQVTFDNNMLEYFNQNTKRSQEPIETLAWKKKTQEKPDKDRVGRYKTLLSFEEIQEFNLLAYSELIKYNYTF